MNSLIWCYNIIGRVKHHQIIIVRKIDRNSLIWIDLEQNLYRNKWIIIHKEHKQYQTDHQIKLNKLRFKFDIINYISNLIRSEQ
jgi:hypothetical protein